MVKNGKRLLYRKWVLEWLDDKKNYVKESTYANYANIVYNHLIPSLGNYRLGQINNKVLQDMIIKKYSTGRLDGNGGLSDKTIHDIGTVLKLSLKSAIKNNLIDYINLELFYPKSNKVNKIYTFNKVEQKKIINYCMNNINSKSIGILISLYTGLRIGELCALKWEDIDFRREILTVNKTIQRIYLKEKEKTKIVISEPKTKNANREIPLPSGFVDILKKIKTSNDNFIISNSHRKVEPRRYRKYYYSVITKLGVSNLTFHSLRHTFASNCIRLGVDYKTVSELLGHSSVNITLNIYVHSQMSQKKKCINLIYRENNSIIKRFNNIDIFGDSIFNTYDEDNIFFDEIQEIYFK